MSEMMSEISKFLGIINYEISRPRISGAKANMETMLLPLLLVNV